MNRMVFVGLVLVLGVIAMLKREAISEGVTSLVGSAKNRAAMIAAMIRAGITNVKEQAMLLAQIDHESAGFSRMEESFRYSSPERLMSISLSARNAGLARVQAALASGPAAVAEIMYGGRMGNTSPGDGYKYRGRGFIQLTGKENYTAAGKALGIDLVNNPDLAAQPDTAARVALWYWRNRVGSTTGGSGDVEAVTRKINGGTIGLADRQKLYATYLNQANTGGLA